MMETGIYPDYLFFLVLSIEFKYGKSSSGNLRNFLQRDFKRISYSVFYKHNTFIHPHNYHNDFACNGFRKYET